jgi:UDPglucose 6-dehydrogenase
MEFTMEDVVQKLESHAESILPLPTINGLAIDQRVGAVTPAAQRLSRPLGAIDVPHKKVERVCCIGAGYVGMSLSVRPLRKLDAIACK